MLNHWIKDKKTQFYAVILNGTNRAITYNAYLFTLTEIKTDVTLGVHL